MTDPTPLPEAAPSPAVPVPEESVSPAIRLARSFFFIFLACFVVFVPFGVLITETLEGSSNESNFNTLPPVSTSDTPPRIAPPRNPGTPRTNQPTPIDPRMVPPSNPPGAPMLSPGNAPSNSPDNPYAAQGAAIREYLLGFTNFVRRCRAAGGTVQSGGGGAPLCSNDSTLFWPTLSLCGQNASDTFFTVLRGDSDNWDFTVTCRDFPACNGPENALCSDQGCVFGGTCAAR